MELSSLTNLKELCLSSNNFKGKIPSLANWTELQKLEIQASGLQGPIPASVSHLSNMNELIISDLYGEGSQFPNLSSRISMQKLMLRSCNITGRIPDYISQMSNLRLLDLSFNNLEGDIPDLNTLNLEKIEVDLLYNNFEKTVPPICHGTPNLFRSYSGGNNTDLGNCLSACSKDYYPVHINCAGQEATIGKTFYEADLASDGAAKFSSRENWGASSTGHIWQRKPIPDDYSATNVSVLTMHGSELYTTARLSPLSFNYYGRCLANGNYTVTLHFAEIVFRDNRSFQSLGRRAFDVYVQGVNELKNFDIRNEAGGVDKAVTKTIKTVLVTNKTLEIRFQYSGKGTTAVPTKGVYSPLLSAISMKSDFKPPTHGKKIIFVAIGVALCLTLIGLGIAWQRGYIGDQYQGKKI